MNILGNNIINLVKSLNVCFFLKFFKKFGGVFYILKKNKNIKEYKYFFK